MTGKLVVVSAPSGAGKDTILKMFLDKHKNWVMPVSTTTREPRHGEINGRDMQFIDEPTFIKWQKEDKFLEAIKVNDNKWYGTLKEPVEDALSNGENVILRKDVRGALIIKEKMPSAKLVFITLDNWEDLEARIRARGTENNHQIEDRLALAKKELTYQDKYDFIIKNPSNHPESALIQLEKSILNT